MSHRKGTQSRNLAYFSTRQKFLFTEFFRSLAGVAPMRRVYIVTSDDNAAAAAKSLTAPARKSEVQVKSFSALGFQRVPVSFREIAHRLTDWIGPAHQDAILAVDMSWGLATNSAMANFEKWMATPAVFIVNLIAFVFICFHAVTWFMLVPRVMARQVLSRPTPDLLSAAPNFGIWLVASVIVALFALRVI